MVKVIVVYDTKWGNTKLVAETIAEGMKGVEGIETMVIDVKEAEADAVAKYDAILIGSPNHIGGPVRGVKKLIDKLGKAELQAKWAAVFDTQLGGNQFERAVKKMEKRIQEKAPGLQLIVPGLSIKVAGMQGPVADGELPKCKAFGEKIAAQLTA
jgi:flavorubredoxin